MFLSIFLVLAHYVKYKQARLLQQDRDHTTLIERQPPPNPLAPGQNLSRYNRIWILYTCPIGGSASRNFDLGVRYIGAEGADDIEWDRFDHVGYFDGRERRDYQPIKAKSVFHGTHCPEGQSLEQWCTYSYAGHLNADIFTHFIALEMVVNPGPGEAGRAPKIFETCSDRSRDPRPKCQAPSGSKPSAPSHGLCTIHDVDFRPFVPPRQGPSPPPAALITSF